MNTTTTNNPVEDCLWYHGKLSNSELQKLLNNSADFLVRKSLHQEDQFTLSVHHSGKIHHFRINKTSKGEFLFDNERVKFKSIKELIEYHLNNSISITKSSNCFIRNPINRTGLVAAGGDDNDELTNESSSYYELTTPAPKPTASNNSHRTILLNTDIVLALKKRNILVSASSESNLVESTADEKEKTLKQKSSSRSKQVEATRLPNADSMLNLIAPPKPKRVPTMKETKRPDIVKLVCDYDEIDEDYESEYDRIKFEKQRKLSSLGGPPKLPPPAIPSLLEQSQHDITMPLLNNFRTIFDITSYKCDLISDRTKRLDRNALNEINKLFLYNKNDTAAALAFNLAKCITYEDIQLLRYNYDFGLGVSNGIELLCLPHGNFIRIDVIDRHKTYKLFICLLVTLCQISVELRVKLIILWIDCAFYLFEKLKNMFAFNFIMEALNHEQIKRLHETWTNLKESNEIKLNLFARLNEHHKKLSDGDYFLIEKEALIPNIYPIAILLCENVEFSKDRAAINELLIDYNNYKWLIDTFLSVNARNYLQNSIDYSKRSEYFLEAHYAPLFSFKYQKQSSNDEKLSLLKLNYLTQTEFHKILLWSNDARNYIGSEYLKPQQQKSTDEDSLALVELNMRIKDINAIISILSSKLQS